MAKKTTVVKNIELSIEDVQVLTIHALKTKNLVFKLFVQNLLSDLAKKIEKENFSQTFK